MPRSQIQCLAMSQASLVRPDYGLEPAEVFIQATWADLRDSVYGDEIYKESPETFHKGDMFHPQFPMYPESSIANHTGLRPDRFRILNWAKSSAPHRLPGLPSWALDFSDSTVFTGDAEFRYGCERWTFDGNSDLNQRAMLTFIWRQQAAHGPRSNSWPHQGYCSGVPRARVSK